MKWILIILAVLCMFSLVEASEDAILTYSLSQNVSLSTLCYSTNGSKCTIIDNCNASIYYPNWTYKNSTNLIYKDDGFFNKDIGKFNITGEYKVLISCLMGNNIGVSRNDFRISNNTVKEISEGFNMLGIVMIPLFLGVMLLLGALWLGKEHEALKIGLFIAAFVTVFMAGYLAINSTTNTVIQDAIAQFVNQYIWIFILIAAYFLLYIIVVSVKSIKLKKEQRGKY